MNESHGEDTSPNRWLRRFALLGGAFAVILLPFSYHASEKLETAVHIQGGEAEAVQEELATQFGTTYVNRVVVVVQGIGDPDSAKGSEALKTIVDAMQAEPGVSGALSRLDSSDQMFVGKNGGTLVVVGLKPEPGSLEPEVERLRVETSRLQGRLRGTLPDVRLQLTGEIPLNLDFRKVSSEDVNHAESMVLPVTLVLLLIAFGSVVAAMLPLGVGMLAIAMAMGATAILSRYLHLSILLQNLVTMLGLGLGIDYALLMVGRFREALAEGDGACAAAEAARRRAVPVLLVSASTVAIGFAALLWVPVSELRSIGIGGLLVAGMSLVLCTLVLPYVLSLIGTRINFGTIQLAKRRTSRGGHGYEGVRWRRWGMMVTGRPWLFLALAGLPLLLLAGEALHLSTGLPDGNWLPENAESVRAFRSLQGMQRSGIVDSFRVILEMPAGSGPESNAGWGALSRFTSYLKRDARTGEVISLATLTDMAESPADLDLLADTTRSDFLRKDGKAALIEVLPASGMTPGQEVSWVSELRETNLASITGVAGIKLRIGGIPAMNADYEDVVRARMPKVIWGVVGGSFLALLIGFRSVFAAFKAVLLNLLSVSAAFGALVLVFQQGHGSWIFGLAGGVGKIFPMVPILSFAIVFGLSMDYEVFLVARVLEERRRGLGERESVAEGLAGTARLITSAASIMIAVFAAFTMGEFLVVKMLGFTLAVAVLIDATVVRMVIGPALLQLAGDWNWWPFGLAGAEMQERKESEIHTGQGDL